jgi:hypothetical protein
METIRNEYRRVGHMAGRLGEVVDIYDKAAPR